ncbi:803_t:CDS:1, partial [Cetraspora pellucida]
QPISSTSNNTQPTANQKPPQKQSFNYLLKLMMQKARILYKLSLSI